MVSVIYMMKHKNICFLNVTLLIVFGGRLRSCRLILRARLRIRKIAISLACAFCDIYDESQEFLFFECDFTHSVWGKIQKLCLLYKRILVWQDELY